MSKYKTWASLNSEGKQAWGDIFPDGVIPIQNIIPLQATLEGIEKPQRVFLVNWKELTTQQQDLTLNKLCKRSGASAQISKAVYVCYKDHVFFKNAQVPAVEAVMREVLGWVRGGRDV